MSHIDSANQRACAQLLRLYYSVSMLRRLPIYVRNTLTLRKLLFGYYCMYLDLPHSYITLPSPPPPPPLMQKGGYVHNASLKSCEY